jgi:sigma-B regulation protein RsbU (phosphoserine phosphatase)
VKAGQSPPGVIWRDGSRHWLGTGGAPVGLFAESEYREGIVKLESGDVLIAFSDGLIEATNQDGEEWGIQGLLKAAACGAQCSQDTGDLVKLIFHAMDEFSKGHQTDDATLAVVRVI